MENDFFMAAGEKEAQKAEDERSKRQTLTCAVDWKFHVKIRLALAAAFG